MNVTLTNGSETEPIRVFFFSEIYPKHMSWSIKISLGRQLNFPDIVNIDEGTLTIWSSLLQGMFSFTYLDAR